MWSWLTNLKMHNLTKKQTNLLQASSMCDGLGAADSGIVQQCHDLVFVFVFVFTLTWFEARSTKIKQCSVTSWYFIYCKSEWRILALSLNSVCPPQIDFPSQFFFASTKRYFPSPNIFLLFRVRFFLPHKNICFPPFFSSSAKDFFFSKYFSSFLLRSSPPQ